MSFKSFQKGLNNFYKNIWLFRKPLWNFQWWDYEHTLDMLRTCLIVMHKNLEKNGSEIKEQRMKKVRMIKRSCDLLENFIQTNFVEQAEKELGKLYDLTYDFESIPNDQEKKRYSPVGEEEQIEHNEKVWARAQEIEEEQWFELMTILKGQNPEEHRLMSNKRFDDWFDGSGLRNWWN